MTQNYSFVHPNAKIGNNVTIDPFVFIDDNVEIGDGTHLFSHATVLNGSRIGKNCYHTRVCHSEPWNCIKGYYYSRQQLPHYGILPHCA